MRVAVLAVIALAGGSYGGATAGMAGCSRREPPPPPPPEPPPCPNPAPPAATGEATRYDADGTGACSFDASPDRMVAAIAAVDYAKAAWCGACVEVTGPRGRAVVRIVDKCPACRRGDLDLSREAFAAVAPPEAGRVKIEWRPVPCALDTPIGYRFERSSTPHWAALQLRGHRYPIASLELRDRAGAWQPLPRAEHNYFIASDPGRGPYDLRITDTRGRAIEELAVPLVAGRVHAGVVQHPRCPGD